MGIGTTCGTAPTPLRHTGRAIRHQTGVCTRVCTVASVFIFVLLAPDLGLGLKFAGTCVCAPYSKSALSSSAHASQWGVAELVSDASLDPVPPSHEKPPRTTRVTPPPPLLPPEQRLGRTHFWVLAIAPVSVHGDRVPDRQIVASTGFAGRGQRGRCSSAPRGHYQKSRQIQPYTDAPQSRCVRLCGRCVGTGRRVRVSRCCS